MAKQNISAIIGSDRAKTQKVRFPTYIYTLCGSSNTKDYQRKQKIRVSV
jgi:hypothetical protein